MILQLKITIKGSKPPIWRRVEIRDSMNFFELHKIIQIAFNWWDYHLHEFNIRKTNSVPLNHSLNIGPVDELGYEFTDFDYDEKQVRLGDVFKKEKDRVVYTYDFGDDWEHDIVLEKIFSEVEGTFYPQCTKAVREAPEEDSRFEYIEADVIETEKIDSKEAVTEINEELIASFSGEVDEEFASEVFSSDKPNWEKLLDIAEEYNKLKPWEWFDDDQIIAIEDPVSKEFVYCSVMGGAGIEFGLAAYIGEKGYQFLHDLINKTSFDDSFYLKQRSLLMSFSDRKELEDEDYQVLKDHGRSYRGKKQWPLFRSYKPGYHPWILDAEEVRLLSVVVEQVIQFCLQAKNNPQLLSFYYPKIFGRVFDQEANKWESVEFFERKLEETLEDSPLFINELELQELKNSLKFYNVPLEFDSDYMLSPIQENQNERPYFPTLVLCMERKNGLIIFNEMMKYGDTPEASQNTFVGLMKQLNGIPREVWVKEAMAAHIAPIAKKLRIRLMIVEKLPLIDHFRMEMERMYSR